MGKVWIVGLAAAGLAVLAVGERWLAPRVVGGRLATGEAEWIWARPGPDGKTPVAFEAARDFVLPGVPGSAELLVQADEEYILFLNGTRVGGNRYRPGAPLDRYQVAELLRPGRNRLLARLISGRRAGGLLLRLAGGEGLEIVTDSDWQILRLQRRHHLDPDWRLLGGEPPRLWGRPPTGRWREPVAGPLTPLHDELLTGERRQAPRRVHLRGQWQPLARFDAAALGPGEPVTFDWGRERVGYLWLIFDGPEPVEALLYFGTEAPADLDFDAPSATLVSPRGRPHWHDALPRRLRYLTVVATEPPRRALLVPADAERVAPLLAAQEPLEGVFGVDEPPPLVTPVEYELRRQLQRPAGVARR